MTSPAVDFLRRLHGDDAQVTLSGFTPKGVGGRPVHAQFSTADANGIDRWLARWNPTHGIYVTLGVPQPEWTFGAGQPRKEDMRGSRWVWVDLDPRAKEDLAAERNRLLPKLGAELPATVPPPTLTIDSGRGFWGLWALDAELAAADVEAINRGLAAAFEDGDANVVDVGRVGRLPGTNNIKDGAVRPAIVVEDHARVYAATEFPRCAPTTGVAPPTGGKARRGDADGATSRVAYLGDLDRWGVPDRIKVIIAQGNHPDQPKEGDGSRSAWLFDAICGLTRAGVPADLIFAIITDPDWAISESVVELKGRAEAYARRQIDRAREAIGGDDVEFDLNEKCQPKANQHNIRLALDKMGVQLTHDQFADRLLVGGLPGHGPALQDEAVAVLYLTIDERFGFRAGKDFFWMVVGDQARRAAFNPVHDYLDGLVWDGTARVDTWLHVYGQAPDTSYTRAVGALVLLAAVRRARAPGCKFDEMLVLVSPQGTDKSSALAALMPVADWFTDDLPLGADTEVVIERMAGRWIVEAAELKGMRDRRTEHLKAFLSRQVDRARMAYGRITREVPRQCVIVGTTNDEQFLTDLTGNRRFWPVKVERFDVKALRRDRDQLWAEAARREADGESIRLNPALYGAATEAQRDHEHVNPFLEVLEDLLRDMEGKFLAADAWAVLGVRVQDRNQNQNDLLGAAMKHLGWTRKMLRFGGTHPAHCYAKGGNPYRRVLVQLGGDGRWRASYDTAF